MLISGIDFLLIKSKFIISQDILCQFDHQKVDDSSQFLLSGGDSLQAVRFIDSVEQCYNAKFPELLDLLINKTFGDIILHVTYRLSDRPFRKSFASYRRDNSQFGEMRSSDIKSIKKDNLDTISSGSTDTITCNFETKLDTPLTEGNNIEHIPYGKFDVTRIIGRCNKHISSITQCKSDCRKLNAVNIRMDISPYWAHDTKKCVDASPVIAKFRYVYI